MSILLFIAAIALLLCSVLMIFLLAMSRTLGSSLLIAVVVLAAFISPWSLLLGGPLALMSLVLLVTPLRQALITKPVYDHLAAAMPSMSDTEREALDTGTSWWEKQLFMGKPDWDVFAAYPYPSLSEAEQHFLDNEVEQLCAMLDEWQIAHELHDLPEAAWQFIKDNGFLGLIIPKEYGGLEFSPYAQSRVMSKIASRSLTAAVSCMVPNSLGPGELLMHYGTDAQKQYWLPRLASGVELPCFGLTGPEAGSDAGAIPDTGIVCYGEHEGKQVLGLKMNFSKRWITLAPIATVIGLAFKLYDPQGLLGDAGKSDYGITCALIPASHQGVVTGGRHMPGGSPFMNGTVEGKDVFIPLDFIIGGVDNAGKGWRMLMACLGVGRGISLPALATAAGEMSYLSVGAFAKVREQFKIPVGKFEGVAEVSSDIASSAYMLEAFRHLVTCGLNQGGTPSVMTAMAKYYATETMRRVVNHGMDIVGGRAIQMGPRNFLAAGYQTIPVSITVEGANILTRSLMIFGQGAMRCHPYLYDELQLLQQEDTAAAIAEFDQLFYQHLGYTLNRGAAAFVAGYFGGSDDAPVFADRFTRRYYKHINRLSCGFAVTADMALGLLAGDLKRKEMLSGRLADIHAHLFIATAILQHYAHGSQSHSEQRHAKLALEKSLHAIQEAFFTFFANFPNRIAAKLVGFLLFPTGKIFTAPSDELKQQVAELMLADGDDNPVRQQLKNHVYYTTDSLDAFGRMENAYQRLLAIEPLWHRFNKARHRGEFAGLSFEDHIISALQQDAISNDEATALIDYNGIRFDAMLTDVFDGSLSHPQPRHNPHNLENAADNLTDYAAQLAAAEDLQASGGGDDMAHGYEPDGDVKSVQEQQQADIQTASQQADFAQDQQNNPQHSQTDNLGNDSDRISDGKRGDKAINNDSDAGDDGDSPDAHFSQSDAERDAEDILKARMQGNHRSQQP